MSICAHESFMSMLMKLSCARARGVVTLTTTLGQYAGGMGVVLDEIKTVSLQLSWS